jgi:two-component system, NtrC family, response regulator HydG
MKKHSGNILIIDDDEHVVFTSRFILKEYFENVETLTSPKTLETKLKQLEIDVILLDMNFKAGTTSGNEGIFWLSRIRTLSPLTQVVLQTAYTDIELAVRSIREGAVDFLPKPWDKEKLVSTIFNAYKLACTRRENCDLKNKQRELHKQLNGNHFTFIASAPAMKHVLHAIDQVAPTNANVLLLGENGTGKEVVARTIHSQSQRAEEPFITIDLGAIPANLFESELFGHERGAFTDAKDTRVGRLELANKGTLFLDEIGNLPIDLQVKLLSVLETRTVTRLGSNRPIALDVRLICATNARVADLVKKGAIRQDLYYRINTVEINLPALRERTEDIPVLAKIYAEEYSRRYHRNFELDPSLFDQLSKYHWPGNIRELQHAVERAVILCTQPQLSIRDFQLNGKDSHAIDNVKSLNLSEMEKDVIRLALKRHNNNLTRAAEELGIGRSTLYRKMEEYGISE